MEVEGPARLDATVGKVNHDEKKHSLFKGGRNKAGVYEVQFKLLLGGWIRLPVQADQVNGMIQFEQKLRNGD